MQNDFPLKLFTSGCYGEQQGGGSCRGGDGRRRRRGGQVVRRVRRSDRRPLPALLHGALLAHTLPQVLVLPRAAGRIQQHLLQQRGHDPLQERLHQVRPSRHPAAAVCTHRFSPFGFKRRTTWTNRCTSYLVFKNKGKKSLENWFKTVAGKYIFHTISRKCSSRRSKSIHFGLSNSTKSTQVLPVQKGWFKQWWFKQFSSENNNVQVPK